MRILFERPPMFEEIDTAFRVRGKDINFAWGDRIYRPHGNGHPPAPSIVVHEQVHGARQLAYGPGGELGVMAWWKRYIDDPAFRLAEEIPAHIAEFQALAKTTASTKVRRRYCAIVATKLASPLYGRLMSVGEAKKLLGASYGDR